MTYNLGTASRATGKSKSTILRAIRNGKISAEKDVHGQWIIEPGELHRVYPEKLREPVASSANEALGNNGLLLDIALLNEQLASARKEIEHLEGMNSHLKSEIEDLKGQREQLRADVEAWRAMATQKRLTWRGLFGGGKAE